MGAGAGGSGPTGAIERAWGRAAGRVGAVDPKRERARAAVDPKRERAWAGSSGPKNGSGCGRERS